MSEPATRQTAAARVNFARIKEAMLKVVIIKNGEHWKLSIGRFLTERKLIKEES